ncbi:TMEM175 family protein [Spirosoma telluris]|uniref:TMEM175 family protein n=1 Tax=Spirosoma telluris TaxID=2183553 RepID=UPI002FC30058
MNYFSKSRVEAFSDGVFAIIVTLLVLEIKVPHIDHHESVAELTGALYALLPKFISWIISFLMVCVIWVNHHRLLNQIANITHAIFWLNALLLLWCSFIPSRRPCSATTIATRWQVLSLA